MIQQPQQLIVQHLQLAQRAVAAVDPDGIIPSGPDHLARLRRIHQVEDILLHPAQDGGRIISKAATPQPAVMGGQDIEKPAALTPQPGQQGIAGLHIERIFHAALLLCRTDITPELPAGIQGKDIHVRMFPDGPQDLQKDRRQIGDAEEVDALGQGRPCNLLQKTCGPGGAMLGGVPLAEHAPQFGLPGLQPALSARVQQLMVFPGRKHLGPEDQVLVIGVRQDARQLVESEAAGILFQVMPDRSKFRFAALFRQGLHELEGHDLARKDFIFIRSEQLVQQGIRKRKAAVGADPVASGQLHGEPAVHTPALHHDCFRGKDIG